MNGWTAALLAAGLFLLLYAVLLLTRKGDGGDQKLGTGFVLLAAVIWGLAFGRLLNDFWLGMQIGVSAACLVPAIGMLIRPRKRGFLLALVLLMIGVGLGAPVVGTLWDRLSDAAQHDSVDEIENALRQVSRQVEDSIKQLQRLDADRETVTRDLRRFGYTTLEAIEEDRQASLRLDELEEIDRLQSALADRLVLLREKRDQLEVGLRRAERLEGAESAAGDDLLDIDVESIMREIEAAQLPERAATVEEHLRRRRKQELLDQTMPGG